MTTITETGHRASSGEAAQVLTRVVAPTIGMGVISRRPRMMALAQRLQMDWAATHTLRRLRARNGDAPLFMRPAGRSIAIVLAESDVERILVREADRFTPADAEEHAALRHFPPHGSLSSRGTNRARQREYHEAALETGRATHHLGATFQAVTEHEARGLGELAVTTGGLDWWDFDEAWWRAARTVVFGAGAHRDRRLTELLNRLRADADWAFLHHLRPERRRRFEQALRAHLRRAEPGSLAAALPPDGDVDPAAQVPHWLFALDAAAIVAYRALALLATHSAQRDTVLAELAGNSETVSPYLRACVEESARLWPTTPMVLRDSVGETVWDGASVPSGTGFLIYTPFFHRDETMREHAHEFAPQSWLDEDAPRRPGTIPFSAGPGRCPGENLVLLLTTSMLRGLLRQCRFAVDTPVHLDPAQPLPMTCDNFGLAFRVSAR
ncbi:cytochrome P450 [Allosaccharopolyspora coralli]|uniref:Cytochrome P450 n=1 Tax=Allosaccharopolyspora coralli TaxID=2665642 RepID=A0A5Q3QIM1_9PSEU|nr:cytochrome P450 [Allosaccharopolyspora coralli]QGK70697.1 cytochrome P450 [Allosaccharopolyspora coralli]